MISVTIHLNNQQECVGFQTLGHAEYADPGYDIICAAVSVLTLNTINSIQQFTESKFHYEEEQSSGKMVFHLEGDASPEAKLLLSSMVLGLQGIQDSYGKKFLCLNFKEV